MYNKKKIALTVLLLLMVGGVYFYMAYNEKPDTDVRDNAVDIRISSKELLATFESNENLASNMYVQKTVEVQGIIKKITHFNNRYTILLKGTDKKSYVLCDMLPSEVNYSDSLEIGNRIGIRGICKGYLKDVILLNCILINTKHNE